MPRSTLDHLVVAAPALTAGADFIRKTLGVELSPGGAHPRIGTHNLLLGLGPDTYLEVIAINPVAPPPGRPRWFALDSLTPTDPPRLATWVARIDDITTADPSVFGPVESMSRGSLHWLITVPPDGRPPFEGLVPHLIQWQAEPHPAARLPESGCRLAQLDLFHPDPVRISAALAAIGFTGQVSVHALPSGEPPRLAAHLQTPAGRRTLTGENR